MLSLCTWTQYVAGGTVECESKEGLIYQIKVALGELERGCVTQLAIERQGLKSNDRGYFDSKLDDEAFRKSSTIDRSTQPLTIDLEAKKSLSSLSAKNNNNQFRDLETASGYTSVVGN
jgi:hypothetical protein